MAKKQTHPFSDSSPESLPFFRMTIEDEEGFRQLVGVVPGYVSNDHCVLFMADNTYVLTSPHSLFPLTEEQLAQWVDPAWLVPTKALKDRDLYRAFRVIEAISTQEVEDRLSRIYSVLKDRTFGLGELKLDIQTNDESPYECEFSIGPYALVLTDTPAGMSWIVVRHYEHDEDEKIALYPWEGRWDAAQTFFECVGHYAIHHYKSEYGSDVMRAENGPHNPTPFAQIPRKA